MHIRLLLCEDNIPPQLHCNGDELQRHQVSYRDLCYFHVVWEMIVFKWHFEGNRHTLMGEISGMISEQKHCHQVSKQ